MKVCKEKGHASIKNSSISFLFTISGCGSAWLERLVWDQEVAGSNPVTPIHITLINY